MSSATVVAGNPPLGVRLSAGDRRWQALVAATLFAAIIGGLFYRSSRAGLELRDFRDAVYYPVVALLEGHNPYDTTAYRAVYPVEQEFPPYLPVLLTLYLPFGLLRFATAQVVYFFTTALFTVALAAATLYACRLRMTTAFVFGLAALLILSRPGYWNLALGQVTVPVVIGMYVTLREMDEHPWVAALGMAFALLKPTYGVPLAVLLSARGRYGVVIKGALLAGVLSLGPALALAHSAGGVGPLVDSALQSYASFSANPDAGAHSSPDRIDAVALLAHMLGRDPSAAAMLAICVTILALGALAVRLSDALPTGRPLADAISCLTVLACTYHQAYDLLALALPLTALAAGRLSPSRWRWVLFACLLVPALDYVSARPVLQALGAQGMVRTLLISINGGAILVALATCFGLAWLHGSPTRAVIGVARTRRAA